MCPQKDKMPMKINFKEQILAPNGKKYFWLRQHESFLLALAETRWVIRVNVQ